MQLHLDETLPDEWEVRVRPCATCGLIHVEAGYSDPGGPATDDLGRVLDALTGLVAL